MKWKRSESSYGAVVSDTPTGWDNPENVAAYGGYLVAESIPNHLAPLVAAAPELLDSLVSILDWLDDGNRVLSDSCLDDVNKARRVIAETKIHVIPKAKGE